MNAIKANYNRKTKAWDVEFTAVEPGEAIAALNSGFLVYDDDADTLEKINRGALIGSWSAGKRFAVIAFLTNRIVARLKQEVEIRDLAIAMETCSGEEFDRAHARYPVVQNLLAKS